MTYGELMDEAIKCQTPEEAQALLVSEEKEGYPRDITLQNIGYMTGYYDRETAARVLKLFGTTHPILGAIDEWPKTPEETLAIGMRMGEAAKRRMR